MQINREKTTLIKANFNTWKMLSSKLFFGQNTPTGLVVVTQEAIVIFPLNYMHMIFHTYIEIYIHNIFINSITQA